MHDGSAREFTAGDEAYQDWVLHHPDGFVVNTPRNRTAGYMVLHRATCPTISKYTRMARPGGYTERDYIKVCATDVESLRSWTKRHGRPDGSFTRACGLCKPL